jgi:hypothetical protein
MIFSIRSHNESVIGMDITSLVNGVIPGAQSPSRIASRISVVEVVLVVTLRAWRKAKVHKVGDGGLTLSTVY